jgi:hypothetical protein
MPFSFNLDYAKAGVAVEKRDPFNQPGQAFSNWRWRLQPLVILDRIQEPGKHSR